MTDPLKLMQVNGQLLERLEAAEARCARLEKALASIRDRKMIKTSWIAESEAMQDIASTALSDTAQQETGPDWVAFAEKTGERRGAGLMRERAAKFVEEKRGDRMLAAAIRALPPDPAPEQTDERPPMGGIGHPENVR